jgi:hypothetical protein
LRSILAALVVGAALACGTLAASAEPMKDREVIKEIAGRAVSCRDAYGQNVHAVLVANLGDVGRARNLHKTPVIMLDPGHLNPLPAKLQLFFFGHECAHHVLGHVYVMRQTAESEADCWSAKDGRDRGLFTRSEVESWAPWFAKSRGSSISGHLPGPERAKFILACFDDQGDRVPAALTSRE